MLSTNFWKLTMPSNVLLLHSKQTFPPIIWIFTESEGGGIESSLSFKILSTLLKMSSVRTIFYHEGFFLIPKTILLEDSLPIRVLTLLPIEVRIWKTNEFLYDFDRSDIMFEKLAKKYNRGSGSSGYYISESLPSSRQGVYFINNYILIS